ncbi:hypothetical protein GCM10010413_41160 [Promicromonospora sukumoe]|uniref:Uncharacterized protein n=1 Tax=Promicromonospora sukumoe TaxID=88382 RepID=A0A7W3JE51_9MICO|nr:hypothetical protein [Promicromonospora sukumoe]MBA8811176.1 hypothetical protein [Promicromonospora sukumoe]
MTTGPGDGDVMPRTEQEAWWQVSGCLGEAIDALAWALTVFPQSPTDPATADQYDRMDRASAALVEQLDETKRRLGQKEMG